MAATLVRRHGVGPASPTSEHRPSLRLTPGFYMTCERMRRLFGFKCEAVSSIRRR
jgi:hypothetical protein